jgi:hypothetical protein
MEGGHRPGAAFGIAARISRERPFASTRRSGDDGGRAAAAPAARRPVSSSGVRRSGAFLLGRGFGALVEQALGIARPVQREWRAGAVTQQPPARPRGQRPRSGEAADRAAFATPRRNWWWVTNDNGLRADVILALDRLHTGTVPLFGRRQGPPGLLPDPVHEPSGRRSTDQRRVLTGCRPSPDRASAVPQSRRRSG